MLEGITHTHTHTHTDPHTDRCKTNKSYAWVYDRDHCFEKIFQRGVVGTQLNEKVNRTVSLYSFSSGQTEKIKSMIYLKFVVCDLDGDNRSELMVIQNGEAEAANGTVRLYSYSDGNVVGSVEAKLSVAPEHIRRIAVNKLSSGEPAVYIASACNENAVITDIFALREGVFSAPDKYLALIYPRWCSAVDYLPEQSLVFLGESGRLGESLKAWLWQWREDSKTLLESGFNHWIVSV